MSINSKKPFNNKLWRVGFFLLATVIIAVLNLPIVPASILLSSGEDIIYEAIITEPTCQVTFKHSVNKGDVKEEYIFDTDNQLISMSKGYFQGYGAGMLDIYADTADMNFRLEDGYFVLDFPTNWQESIGYIGGNVAQHKFIYNDHIVEVGNLYPREPFTLSVSRRSLIDIILKKL